MRHLRFDDHHRYTLRDAARIAEAFKNLPGIRKIVVTTEKDAPRLQGLLDDLPVYVMPVKVAFHRDGELDFDQVVSSAVRENISFLAKLTSWGC